MFDDFLPDQRERICRLPFLVGLWISHADDNPEYERDEERERLALELVLDKIADNDKKAPFTSMVAGQALKHKHLWEKWSAAEHQTLDEVTAVMALLGNILPADNVRNYGAALNQIAVTVAQAYGEIGPGPDDLSREAVMGGLLNKIIDRFTVKANMESPENVSPAEKAALQKLQEIVRKAG